MILHLIVASTPLQNHNQHNRAPNSCEKLASLETLSSPASHRVFASRSHHRRGQHFLAASFHRKCLSQRLSGCVKSRQPMHLQPFVDFAASPQMPNNFANVGPIQLSQTFDFNDNPIHVASSSSHATTSKPLQFLDASAVWSSGMILAQGASGPGLNSRNSPSRDCVLVCTLERTVHSTNIFLRRQVKNIFLRTQNTWGTHRKTDVGLCNYMFLTFWADTRASSQSQPT